MGLCDWVSYFIHPAPPYHDIGNGGPPGIDYAEPLTIVVGHETECKVRVARALANARGATKEEVSKAGVRTFTRELQPNVSRSAAVVIDTKPLSITKDLPRVDAARLWLAQNSLRQLGGKLVFLVCVIASTDPEDEMFREPDLSNNIFSWLQLLACVFEHHLQKVMILVSAEDSTHEAYKRLPQSAEVIKRDGFAGENIIFFNYGRGELAPTVKSVLQRSMSRDDTNEVKNGGPVAGSFFLPAVGAEAKSDRDRFGPWGPQNIIVFGRTGSGKSTLAQMLTQGRLDIYSKKLSISASIRGVTKKVRYAQGRGWRVIDTPGLGESIADEKSSVPTKKAANLIKEYVQMVEGTFCHFVYVWKKARVDDLDERLWGIFKLVFKGEMDHVTVVVSDADQDWLDVQENIDRLRKCFEGCQSFVPAYFPQPDEDYDYYAEEELRKLRQESLKALEEELAGLSRTDTNCRMGMWSEGTQRSLMVRGVDEVIYLRPGPLRTSPAFGSSIDKPHPSDYETARALLRMKSFKLKIISFFKPSNE